MSILPILLLLMGQQTAPPTSQAPAAETRQAPAQTQNVTSREAPATPPPAPQQRQVRGPGIPGPGPAVGGQVSETPVITHHSIVVNGRTINYTAKVGQMPLKNPAGDTEAHIFYMAYTVDGQNNGARRPLTFCFNGGPGSASMWVHMGGMGPRSPKLMPNGSMPPPPYQLIDNKDTWLDTTDLVFVDPVGTGYSRAKNLEIAKRMNGVQGDIQSVGEFMRLYVAENNRELSPLFIAGESYGTFRAAGLAGYLIDRGLAFNGIVLIGTTLNLETIWSRSDDLVYELELPTYAADAWYHKKIASDLQKKDLKSVLKEAEDFALGEYALALNKGDKLSGPERKAIVDKLVRYTGLDATYIEQSNLRFDVQHFTRQLLRDRNQTIGRYDGRLTGDSSLNTGETSEYDPSSTEITPPFTAAFTSYIRNELNYKTDMYYYPSGGIQPWDYGVQNGFGDTTSLLRNAFTKNPYMKVMIAAGYFDLATPFWAVDYTFNHMGLHPDMHKRISWDFYPAGHMLYIDSESHAKLHRDVAAFLSSALPEGEAP
ncbi:MAG: peptidase S10 [Acidobacteriaceae bacterium]|nr:peptidase S10 [Acidobacteriaceae bacterium]